MTPKSLFSEQGIVTQLAVMAETLVFVRQNVSDVKADIADIKVKMEQHYVTKEEFSPVKNLVFGMVAVILTAVIGALITLVIRGQT